MSYERIGKYRGLAGAGLGDWLTDITSAISDVGGSALNILGSPQQEQGRAEAMLETQRLLAAQQAAQGSGFDLQKALPLIAIGGGVLLIVLLATKKKAS